jgi:hypothetical protein
LIGRLVRPRTASQKTGNLGRKAFEQTKQHDGPFPKRERRPVLFVCAPCRGSGSGAVLGVPFFHCAGFNMAITPDETALIAEYERLRRELDELDARARQLDRKLIDIEKLLPDHYVFPGDPQHFSHLK